MSPIKPDRLISLDWFRGEIMILMAIDHARLLTSSVGMSEGEDAHETWYKVPDPDKIENSLFLIRFVTHICAPGFFFLMVIIL
jgi:uncharacterized membrane protein